MQWHKILTPLAAVAALSGVWGGAAWAQPVAAAGNETLLQMQEAFRKGDKPRLRALLPSLEGYPLQAWGAYWELRSRLQDASQEEIEGFLSRWAGTYQEDRLRNDWLLLLGQRRDWGRFQAVLPGFRMQDDPQVRCYSTSIALIEGRLAEGATAKVRSDWYGLRNADDGCTHAAGELYSAQQFSALDVWRKARLGVEANRVAMVRGAVTIVAPEALPRLTQIMGKPAQFLLSKDRSSAEATLALVRLAMNDPDAAASQMDRGWAERLGAEERHWVWGVIGKRATQRLSPNALGYFGKVRRESDLAEEHLEWKVRAALRAGDWDMVQRAIQAMPAHQAKDPAWVYWKARALTQSGNSADLQAQAQSLWASVASPRGFYEQLSLEALGQRIVAPARPEPLTAQERQEARNNPFLQRALQAIQIGLRSEGVREWNYAVALHHPGGMTERELLAAADFACEREVWDRCINTSERTRTEVDFTQRYPMPLQSNVVSRSQSIGLDPAYVYGLIRQESRFIMDARSVVGASGLMQVMPATAQWTAKKIGLTDFKPAQIYERDTNILIGTAYLKMALDDFEGSMAMAAAGYNAGPGRPRQWRNGPVLEGAIWAESIPFAETRDYVKKVLSNTTNYAALITGQPQSLVARLGEVGPKVSAAPASNPDLP